MVDAGRGRRGVMGRSGLAGWRPEKLREAREAAGLSMSALARRAGVSQPMMSRYERGESAPSVEALARIAAALGKRPADFLDPEVRGMAALRAARGLSQQDVVEQAGIPELTTGAYSHWETGRVRRIRSGDVEKLAALFGVPVDVLLEAHAQDVARREAAGDDQRTADGARS